MTLVKIILQKHYFYIDEKKIYILWLFEGGATYMLKNEQKI